MKEIDEVIEHYNLHFNFKGSTNIVLGALKTIKDMESEPNKSEYTQHWIDVFQEYIKEFA